MNNTKLHYILDPMCSWCWAFRPSWLALLDVLPENISVEYIMGGLAPDSDEPMPAPLQEYLQSVWQSIETRTGVQFNHDFWNNNQPRRSTYPACRAVIAAGFQSPHVIPDMISGIQKAYYRDALNPSDKDTLLQIAATIGLDTQRFAQDLESSAVENKFQDHLGLTREFGVQGFPCIVIEQGQNINYLAQGYCDKDVLLRRYRSLNMDSTKDGAMD